MPRVRLHLWDRKCELDMLRVMPLISPGRLKRCIKRRDHSLACWYGL